MFVPLFEGLHVETVQIDRTKVRDALLPSIDLMPFENLKSQFTDRDLLISVNLSVHVSIFHFHTDASNFALRMPSSLMQFVESFHHLYHLIQCRKAKMPVQRSDPIFSLFLPHSQCPQFLKSKLINPSIIDNSLL